MSPLTIGDFLQDRRAKLQPQDLKITPLPGSRRVRGLRRQEAADAIGISVEYYTRLEQNRGGNISMDILEAIARGLRLTHDERAHLFDLARPFVVHVRDSSYSMQVSETLWAVIEAYPFPAFVIGRGSCFLAINEPGKKLLVDLDTLPLDKQTMAYYLFTVPAARRLYPDWEKVARDTVARLRFDVGRYTTDEKLKEHVRDLLATNEDFAGFWKKYDVQIRTVGTKVYHHPDTGEQAYRYQTYIVAEQPEQTVVMYVHA